MFSLILERYEGAGEAHVVVPEGVTRILGKAFAGHDEIQSVQLPDTLLSIGESAFSGCTALKEMRIPESVF